MPTLIISLPHAMPAAAAGCEFVLSADGATSLRHDQVPLPLLPSSGGAEVVAVVPARALSWHQVELPPGTLERRLFQEGGDKRLRSVLDGLLEDRVLDEPAKLHFALEPQARVAAPVWVAACDRAWLHAWLTALELAGRPVSRIVPEVAPPEPELPDMQVLYLCGTADSGQLVHSGPAGVVTLPLTAATAALIRATPETQIISEPAVADLAAQYFDGHVELQTGAQRALAAAQSGWDLAQFDCSVSAHARSRKLLSRLLTSVLQAPQWRAARWAVVALVVVNIAGLQAWSWQQQAALAARRAAIGQILTDTFPDVRVVVNAPLQMARAVADLQRQSGVASGADLETMLGHFQAVAPDFTVPAAIDFIAGELRLKGVEAAGGVGAAQSRLQARGYTARMDGNILVLKQERQP